MSSIIKDRRICLFAEEMFEDMELFYPLYRLAEEGAELVTVGLGSNHYTGKHGLTITPDKDVDTAINEEFDAIVIPGGYAPDKLRVNDKVLEIVRKADALAKPVAAICHAAWVVISADIVSGRRMTCFWSIKDDVINAGASYADEAVVIDGNLITSRYPPDLGSFCLAIIDQLAQEASGARE